MSNDIKTGEQTAVKQVSEVKLSTDAMYFAIYKGEEFIGCFLLHSKSATPKGKSRTFDGAKFSYKNAHTIRVEF